MESRTPNPGETVSIGQLYQTIIEMGGGPVHVDDALEAARERNRLLGLQGPQVEAVDEAPPVAPAMVEIPGTGVIEPPATERAKGSRWFRQLLGNPDL